MAEHKNVTNYLHLPLQSASNRILMRMRRGYTIQDYMSLVNKGRKILPDLTLTTDILIGFPGEKDEDFKETIMAVKKIRFDQSYMFAYSERKSTLSALFNDNLEKRIKNNRLRYLIEVQNEITEEKAHALKGKELEVLVVDKAKKGGKIGKSKNGKIIIVNGVAKIGSSYIVKINRINGWVPIGEIKKEV